MITLAPGSPYPWGELNPKITPQVKEMFRKKFHLDQPLYKQYWLNMQDLFSGRLKSIKDDRPVLQKILERLPATITLNIAAILLSLTFGLLLGIYCARHAGKPPDFWVSLLAFVFIAVPTFWIANMAIIGLVKFTSVPVLGTQSGIGSLLPALIGGAVIVETIFAYPGMGRLGYEAVLERDYPTLVALNFIVAALVLLGNLLSDILYAVVDPRVRLE